MAKRFITIPVIFQVKDDEVIDYMALSDSIRVNTEDNPDVVDVEVSVNYDEEVVE